MGSERIEWRLGRKRRRFPINRIKVSLPLSTIVECTRNETLQFPATFPLYIQKIYINLFFIRNEFNCCAPSVQNFFTHTSNDVLPHDVFNYHTWCVGILLDACAK
jgi:hypothetical protein